MAITGTEHPSSPQITRESTGNKVYIRRFQYARDYAWEAEMPAIGSFDVTYGYFRGYRSSFPNPAYVIAELVYDSEGTIVNFAPSDGDTEYWAQTRTDETPIEFHPNYRTSWNYNVYYSATNNGVNNITIADFPGNPGGAASWLNATDAGGLRNSRLWRWDKGDPGIDWVLIEPKLKPGLEFYLRPQRVVFRRDYFRDQADANNALKSVGNLLAPGETFGLGTTNTLWLVTASDTQYDGKYWVTETEYLYSATWDGDIYTV